MRIHMHMHMHMHNPLHTYAHTQTDRQTQTQHILYVIAMKVLSAINPIGSDALVEVTRRASGRKG
jgi:hypothetical protein